jgi:uncharacterized spore protein YtfJ
MATSTPPLPPDVTTQQAPAAQQYAQQAAQQGAGAAQQGPQASMQFVLGELKKIADAMGKVAQVLAVEKPVLMPIVTRAAGMLKMIEKQAQESSQGPGAGQGSGSEPPQAAMSAPEGQESLGL